MQRLEIEMEIHLFFVHFFVLSSPLWCCWWKPASSLIESASRCHSMLFIFSYSTRVNEMMNGGREGWEQCMAVIIIGCDFSFICWKVSRRRNRSGAFVITWGGLHYAKVEYPAQPAFVRLLSSWEINFQQLDAAMLRTFLCLLARVMNEWIIEIDFLIEY